LGYFLSINKHSIARPVCQIKIIIIPYFEIIIFGINQLKSLFPTQIVVFSLVREVF